MCFPKSQKVNTPDTPRRVSSVPPVDGLESPYTTAVYDGLCLPDKLSNATLSACERFDGCKSPVNTSDFASTLTGKYTISGVIGQGGFGLVLAGTRIADNKDVAVKVLRRDKTPVSKCTYDDHHGFIPFEVAILSAIQHPNVVVFLDFLQDAQYFYIVTELAGAQWSANSATDLFECLSALGGLTEQQAKFVFKQLLGVLSSIHTLGLTHRDIKDENLLIDADFNVTLIDWGSATYDTRCNNFSGTVSYMAPEVLHYDAYDPKSADVWAAGVLLLTMLLNYNPFENVNTVKAVDAGVPIFEDYLPVNVAASGVPISEPAKDLVSAMLAADPKARPTVQQILQCTWLA